MKSTLKTPRSVIVSTVIACVLGILLSIYAYHVETNIHSDPSFRALCDISEHMSCSKVFSSRQKNKLFFNNLKKGSIIPKQRMTCACSKRVPFEQISQRGYRYGYAPWYGTGFGVLEHIVGKNSTLNQPNSVYGVIFYVIMISLATRTEYSLVLIQLITAISGGLGCVYLAYILMFVLNDLCVVCVSTYFVNFVLIICSVIKYNAVKNMVVAKKEKNGRKKAN